MSKNKWQMPLDLETKDAGALDIKTLTKAVKDINEGVLAEREVYAEIQKEVKKFGDSLPETEEKLAKIGEDVAKAMALHEEGVLAMKRSAQIIVDEDGNKVDLDSKAAEWAHRITKINSKSIVNEIEGGEFGAEQAEHYKSAFITLLCRGGNDGELLNIDEKKALSIGSNPDGGYFVPHDMGGRIVKKVFETSPMRAHASLMTTGRDIVKGLYDNDEVEFGWVTETGGRPETDTAQIGQWSIPVHEMYAQPKQTQQLLDDADFDTEGWLEDKVAQRFGRGENLAFVSGDGSTKPRGFLTYPTGTDLTNSIEQLDSGANGAFIATPNGGDILIDVQQQIKADYRPNAWWYMNRRVLAAVRKLKDSNGQYLFVAGITAGAASTILGDPLAMFEDMPDLATGSLSIAYGDMAQHYQIIDRSGISLLRDPYTAKPFVLFYSRKRVGGDMINGEAMKLINFKA